MLIANGCKVIGYDLDDSKVKIAREKGVIAFNQLNGNDPVRFVLEHTNNIGADGVLIASTKSNDIISQAAKMSRKRGRITLVGVIGLDISRADFYEKELSFQEYPALTDLEDMMIIMSKKGLIIHYHLLDGQKKETLKQYYS